MCSRLKDLSDWLRDLPGHTFINQDEINNELEGCIETARTILDDLNNLVAADDDNAVYWLELPGKEKSADTRLFSAPLDVSEMLNGGLYEGKSTIVFTSATLGIRGKLTYFLRRMGLETMPETRLRTLCLGFPVRLRETGSGVHSALYALAPNRPTISRRWTRCFMSLCSGRNGARWPSSPRTGC